MKNNDDFNYFGDPDEEFTFKSFSSSHSIIGGEDVDEILEEDLKEILKNYVRGKKLLKIKSKI